MQGRDGEVLPKGFHSQVRGGVDQVRHAVEQGGGLTGQVDAGAFGKAEGLSVFGEGFAPQQLADEDGIGVAGVAQAVPEGLQAVAGGPPAVNGIGPALHGDAAGAGVGGLLGDHALLQAHGVGTHLEHRAGVVGVRDSLVPPLLQLGLIEGRVLLVLGQGVDLGLQVLVVDGKGVVGVIGRGGGQAQNGPGVHVHHNGHGAVLYVELVHALCQVFFQDALHGLIDGEHQVVAILGLHILLILKGHIGAQGIAGGDQPPRGAPQLRVVLQLHPVQALAVGAGKSQHRGGHRPIGVIALVILNKAHARGDVVIL